MANGMAGSRGPFSGFKENGFLISQLALLWPQIMDVWWCLDSWTLKKSWGEQRPTFLKETQPPTIWGHFL